jgi:hypothetical protein
MQYTLEQVRRLGRRSTIIVATISLAACAGAGKGAVEGAAGGALAGAAGGLVSSLIWGGDVGEHMARGAATGATIGAIGGAVQGSQRAKAEKQYQARQEQRELEALRREIGNDAFDAVVALAECRHEVAIANARVAAQSTNSNHALAGLWIQALAFADRDDEAGLEAIGPEVVRWDRGVADAEQFDRELEAGYDELLNIRSEHSLPVRCR